MLPRAVLVERPTEYRDLLARHGTREQVRFFLADRGLTLEAVERRHLAYEEIRAQVLAAIPTDWRRSVVDRSELDRFLFAADDVVIALGQDGLVANVAKYLRGQPVVGLDPEPDRHPGVLVRHQPAAAADLLLDVQRGRATLQQRTMAEGVLADGQRLLALNELFVGHASHQSARYALTLGDRSEHQSSSGLIVATGTGATGWAASINGARRTPIALPGPTQPALACLVREAWPSAATGTDLDGGLIGAGEELVVTSELNTGGRVFGDGIESDWLAFDWGERLTVRVARERLALVV
jgi:hypothetical protein